MGKMVVPAEEKRHDLFYDVNCELTEPKLLRRHEFAQNGAGSRKKVIDSILLFAACKGRVDSFYVCPLTATDKVGKLRWRWNSRETDAAQSHLSDLYLSLYAIIMFNELWTHLAFLNVFRIGFARVYGEHALISNLLVRNCVWKRFDQLLGCSNRLI